MKITKLQGKGFLLMAIITLGMVVPWSVADEKEKSDAPFSKRSEELSERQKKANRQWLSEKLDDKPQEEKISVLISLLKDAETSFVPMPFLRNMANENTKLRGRLRSIVLDEELRWFVRTGAFEVLLDIEDSKIIPMIDKHLNVREMFLNKVGPGKCEGERFCQLFFKRKFHDKISGKGKVAPLVDLLKDPCYLGLAKNQLLRIGHEAVPQLVKAAAHKKNPKVQRVMHLMRFTESLTAPVQIRCYRF